MTNIQDAMLDTRPGARSNPEIKGFGGIFDWINCLWTIAINYS